MAQFNGSAADIENNKNKTQSINEGNPKQTQYPSEAAVVAFVNEKLENFEGGSGGGLVDQTYDPTSKNAQSGVAVAEAIELLKNELSYVAMQIKTFIVNPNSVEIGSKVSTVTLNWELNKTAKTVTLDGASVGTASNGSKTFTNLNITTDKQWTLQAVDEKGATAQKTAKLSFLKGIYFGVVGANAEITNDLIKSLDRTLQSGNINRTYTVTPTAEQRIIFALPTGDYNDPIFKIGGFDYTWDKAKTFNFTNASGHTESYTVWRSVQAVADTLSINVVANKK